MPVEQGYEQRVTPQPAAATPLASPEEYGAGVGSAIEQAGGTGHAVALRAYQIQRDLQADRDLTGAAQKLATGRVAIDEGVSQLRTNPTDDNWSDHLEQVGNLVDNALAPATEGISDKRTLDQITREQAATKASVIGNENTWLQAKLTANSIDNMVQSRNTASARVATQPDQPSLNAAFPQEMLASQQRWANVKNIDPKARKDGALGDSKDIATSYIKRLTDFSTDDAMKEIDTGNLGQYGLDGKEIDKLRQDVEIQAHKNAQAKKQGLDAVKAKAIDTLANADELNAAGLPFDQDAVAAAQRVFVAADDRSNATKAQLLLADDLLRQKHEGETPVQLDIERDKINAVPREKRSDAQKFELAYLNGPKGQQLKQNFNEDPVGWAAKHSPTPPPPLTAGIDARYQWANTASIQFGIPVGPLSQDEAKAARATAASGLQGKLEVANQLAQGAKGQEAINAARYVNPDDHTLQALVRLDANDRPLYQAGALARSADRDIIDKDAGVAATVQFKQTVGDALSHFRIDDYNAALEASKNLYAAENYSKASIGLGENYAKYIPRALGGEIATWQNGEKVLLPPGWSEDQFATAVRNYKPGAAGAGADKRPWMPSQNRAMTGEELQRLTPRRIPDGRYIFVAPGERPVRTKSGQIYTAQLPDKP